MKRILLYSLLSLTVCQSVYAKYQSDKKEIEAKHPLQFLQIKAHDHANLVSKDMVEGEITNKAALASFRDIEVKITFKSNTGSTIEAVLKTVTDTISPGATVPFRFKVRKPKGTTAITIDIVYALTDK